MSAPGDRLLSPELIPSSLWDREARMLLLPEALSRAYVARVEQLGLRQLGSSRSEDSGPIGGLSKESADQHLAQAFDGSAARASLAVLDPESVIGSTSDAFIRSTAGGDLALTDAPCGAGAAALAFLTALADLRAANVLPRMPLDVKLVAGELSPHSIDHAKQLFDAVKGDLETQAIFVDAKFVKWDVLDPISTAGLVKESTVHGASCATKLLVIANFNGFLVKGRKQKEAQAQLDELFRYASGSNSLAVWIEPDMNSATGNGGLFGWLSDLFTGPWKRFTRPYASKVSSDHQVYRTQARFRLPLQPERVARVGLAVVPVDLTAEDAR